MRLRTLSLERFGHFTGHQFDFGEVDNKPDFHIFYGQNEAGKTTTMEAALRLFYGFHARESYDFKHQRKNLQVSGQLEIDGNLQHFTRLPKRTGSLCDSSGTTLPETALATHLAGLSQDDYRKLLCLDDETIERGGEEIAQAEGEIGHLLFGAASGVADLSLVLKEVRDSADKIWRKRASTTRIAELKRELSDIETQLREQDVTANQWRDLKKQYADKQTAESNAKTALDRCRERQSQIKAQQGALPKLNKINELTARNNEFTLYPKALDFDPEDLVSLQTEEARLEAELKRLDREIEENVEKHKSIVLEPEIAALSSKLDDLDELRARDVTASQDIERRRREMQQELTTMEQAARDLGITDHADLKSLVLSPANIQQLASNRDELKAAERSLATETSEVADLEERYAEAKLNTEKNPATSASDQQFSDILKRFDAEHLAPTFIKVQQNLKTAEQAKKTALDSLSIGSVHFDRIPTLPSSRIKAQTWIDEHSDLCQKIAETETELNNHSENIATRQAQAKNLSFDRKLVGDKDASSLKEQRDQLWHSHKKTLSNQTADPFEHAMKELDTAMEARVLQATDLGQLRQIDHSLVEAEALASQTKTHLTNLQEKKNILEKEVNDCATAIGLPVPQLPTEWLEWIERHETASEKANDLDELKSNHQSEIERGQKLHQELCNNLDLETPDFETAIFHAREQSEAEKELISTAKIAKEKLTNAKNELSKRQEKKESAKQKKEAAEETWQKLNAKLFGDRDIQESLLNSLDPLRTLREHNDNYEKTAQRVAAMEADQAKFLDEVSSLCKSHNIPTEEDASSTYKMLRKKSNDAQSAEVAASNLSESIKTAKENETKQKNALEDIQGKVGTLGSIFPTGVSVGSIALLRAATAQAQTVIADRKDLEKLESSIIAELGVEKIEQAREILEDTTEAKLHAESVAIETELRDAEQQCTTATEVRTRAQSALASVTGDAELSVLIESKTTLELELEDAAMEHIELTLGSALAEEAIHRYQDTHRSGMMAATESCFSMLTQGAYPKLKVEPGASKETLLAVSKDGVSKRAGEMSKGTRFQLYLALRAAAYEQIVSRGTSLPFFCDDIFETFDEDRTSAACKVMEQIGRTGQAIYLTHHRHVVDIALKVCDESPKIHEI